MTIARDIQVMHYRAGKHYKSDAERIVFAVNVAVSVRESFGSAVIEFDDGSSIICKDSLIHFTA